MMLSLDIALTNISNASVTFGNTDFTMAPATVTNQGIAELATPEEVQDGKDDTRIVTPAGLASRTATEERAGLVELATSAEVKAGTDSARAVTPAGLKSAMDGRTASGDQTGLVELATNDEVQAGIDSEKAVTPAGLASRTATEARTGLAEIATQTEVDAGTDDSRIVTPKKMLAALKKLGLQGIESWRKSMIGCLVPMAVATLPTEFGKPDGSLFLFEDYPELKEKYDGGGFEGMLLEANASDEDKAAWVGKWVKHPQGLGLYAPRLQGLFLRNAGTMGKYNAAGLPDLYGSYVPTMYTENGNTGVRLGIRDETTGVFRREALSDLVSSFINAIHNELSGVPSVLTFSARGYNGIYGAASTVIPASADIAIGLYLGRMA